MDFTGMDSTRMEASRRNEPGIAGTVTRRRVLGVAGQLATRSTPYPSATTVLDVLPEALRQLADRPG